MRKPEPDTLTSQKELSEKIETKQRLAKIEEEMSEIKALLQDIANMRKYG